MAEITEDGKVTGLNIHKPKLPCPTCDRKGKLIKQSCNSFEYKFLYESSNTETCQTCNGDGWIDSEIARQLKNI